MSDIFISYASEDRSRAESLGNAVGELGWSVFWDRTIPTGMTWRQVIGKELDEARCVIVLWSKVSIDSDWVHEEADDGRRRRILIPVLVQDVQPPIGFRSVQAADLSDWDGTKPTSAFHQLVSDVERLVGPVPRQVEEQKRKEAETRKPAGAKKKAEETKAKPNEQLQGQVPPARKTGETNVRPVDQTHVDKGRHQFWAITIAFCVAFLLAFAIIISNPNGIVLISNILFTLAILIPWWLVYRGFPFARIILGSALILVYGFVFVVFVIDLIRASSTSTGISPAVYLLALVFSGGFVAIGVLMLILQPLRAFEAHQRQARLRKMEMAVDESMRS